MKPPKTSETLLKAIASDYRSARWTEFVALYRPMMEGYLQSKFPVLDADDVIQEVFCALVRVLPNYHYNPDESGLFRNYLTAVLRNKACDALKRRHQIQDVDAHAREALLNSTNDCLNLKQSIYRIALDQLIQDDGIQKVTKEIFKAVAIQGLDPEIVARKYGVTRNNVDQIKCRLTLRLKRVVNGLERLGYGNE